ncbi:MAG: tRNA lysidine(34) synthetase TilS [Actinomycetales bacterium]|nr:tRNA lysidine(34) synthetase TilS [Actinomycetales bacterium]
MPTLPASVAAIRTALRSALRELTVADGVSRGDLVLVACSGGADSLALAAATAFVAPRLGLRAGAVSVDHGLQRGSREVSDRAVAVCARLGLEPVWVESPGEEDRALGAGPEGGARALRYAALERAAARTGAVAVLLGHTLEDQAETVLLGLARGSGTRSLAGMATTRGVFLRPLLGVRRAETLAACEELGLAVWHDPTNALDGPLRTAAGAALPRAALRERVLPALEAALGLAVVPALARTAALARDDADYLDEAAATLYEAVRAEPRHASAGDSCHIPRYDMNRQHSRAGVAGVAGVLLDVAMLVATHPALRRRVLRLAALDAGAPAGDLADVHIRAMDRLLTDWHGQGPVHLPGPTEALRACGRLVVRGGASARTTSPVQAPTPERPPHTEDRES